MIKNLGRMQIMNCWICNTSGDTGEHLIKASDMKLLFPDISQQYPAYKHTHDKKNIPIGSRKSNQLKSKALICAPCNNQRTQPHDRAWEKLSDYLYSNWSTIKKTGCIDFEAAFSGSFEESSKFLQLYFLKLFGCLLIESKNKILANEFAKSIMDEIPHDDVFIFFVKTRDFIGNSCVGISDLDAVFFDGSELIRAAWVYMVGEMSLRIVYIHPKHGHLEPIKGWNPKDLSNKVKISKVK